MLQKHLQSFRIIIKLRFTFTCYKLIDVQNVILQRKAKEKRDEYSKKVQMRNQIKAHRQKEIDKAIKVR